jgi:hypothetical protein
VPTQSYNLLNGFTHRGIDNACHMGGFTNQAHEYLQKAAHQNNPWAYVNLADMAFGERGTPWGELSRYPRNSLERFRKTPLQRFAAGSVPVNRVVANHGSTYPPLTHRKSSVIHGTERFPARFRLSLRP